MSAPDDDAAVRPGDAVPPLERQFASSDLVAYGAATWDWHRLHHDQAFAEARGLPGPVLDGQIFGGLFARALVDWLGPQAFVRRLAFRMRAMVFAGDTVRCEGEVSAVERGAGTVTITALQRLRCAERIVAEATTVVELPSD